MSWRKYAWRTPVYVLLVVGSAVFSLPFLWMATTSFKVDRELYAKGLRMFPMSPVPRAKSPYVDDRYFEDVEMPVHEGLAGELARLARETGVELPEDVDADTAYAEIARGLAKRLASRVPSNVWNKGSREEVLAAAAEHVDRAMVESTLASVHRRFSMGRLQVWSSELKREVLGEEDGPDGEPKPLSGRFENLTPEVATLTDRTEKGLTYASVNYDFAGGDRIVLDRTFDVGFGAASLQRIQLYMRPDDTWHELFLTVEKEGRRYVAERAVVLSDYEWRMLTWQWPGPDDDSTKIKTWTVLEEAEALEGGVAIVNDPGKVRLTLELRRTGKTGAWYNKLTRNYRLVLDHIPFWRYVRVSLFLVLANVILAVFSSSLVAYAFARQKWPGREVLFLLVLATLMIPHQVMMIPQFLIWKNLGCYDTLAPLWMGAAFGNAFFIFLLRQFMKGIPRDLEDAARIDGCGFLRIYWHVILPLIKPSLAAIAIFTFLGAWNNFMGPLIFIADQRLYPLAFGLYAFSVQVQSNPALTMAGSVLMTVPVIVVFFFAQRYFIQGVTLTGMKG
jgi:ABC-type glycerol-3-phosphate transport system permease component